MNGLCRILLVANQIKVVDAEKLEPLRHVEAKCLENLDLVEGWHFGTSNKMQIRAEKRFKKHQNGQPFGNLVDNVRT
jgi:hypothetical protein